ncbi:XRE family transcriptional regulator [Candidatus Magnetomorum sp. HK-1]|nr:XRE family transcriptional regulator [Candidatus Magnetomorum sp. HK-1]
MAKNTLSLSGMPPEITDIISNLGNHIQIARKRREMTLGEMSSRMFVSRKTLSRLENGMPGVSLAVLASALWVLGFEKDLMEIARPENDKIGIFKDRQRLPKRVRSSKQHDDLDF